MPRPLPPLGPVDPVSGELTPAPSSSPRTEEKPSKTAVEAASADEEAFPSPASLFSSLHDDDADGEKESQEEEHTSPLIIAEEGSYPSASVAPLFIEESYDEEAPEEEEVYAEEDGEGFTPALSWQEVTLEEASSSAAEPPEEEEAEEEEEEIDLGSEASPTFTFFDDEEDEPEAPEEDSEDDPEEEEEEDEEDSKASSPAKKKGKNKLAKMLAEGGLAEQAKEKFAIFKEQAAAELSGKSAPAPTKGGDKKGQTEDAPPVEVSPSEEDDEGLEEEATDTPSKKAKGMGVQKKLSGATKALEGNKAGRLLLAPLHFLANCYRSIVGFLFTIVEKTLTLLSKLPLVGRGFSWLLKFTRLLKAVALSLPLLLCLGLILLFFSSAPPAKTTLTLPDEGGASFTSFSYDRGTNEAHGVVTNEGNTRIAVTTSFTIYTSHWYDPRTWRAPKEALTCKGPVVQLEIEERKTVTAHCLQAPSGLGSHASGILGE